MIFRIPLTCSPIGIAIDGDVIRVAQTLSNGAVESVDVPRRLGEAAAEGWLGPREVERLDRVLKRRRFQGRSLVLGVPAMACQWKESEVHSGVAGDEALRRAAARELASATPDRRDTVLAVTALPAKQAGPGRCFCAGVISRRWSKFVERWPKRGWRVVGVQARADALAAMATHGPVAWLDAGIESDIEDRPGPRTWATLVVVENGLPLYARSVRTPLPSRLSEASPATVDALAAELIPGLREAQRRCVGDGLTCLRLSNASLAGSAPSRAPEEFAERLADRLGISMAEPALPFELALALSSRERALRNVDLLPPSSRALRLERQALRAAAGAALGYAALVAVLLALWSSAGPDSARAAKPEEIRMQADLAQARAVAVTAATLSAERDLSKLRAKRGASEATADRPDWRHLLDRLAQDAAGRVHFTTVEVSKAPASSSAEAVVQISGEAPNPRAAWDFALALERGDLFDRVDLARTRRVDARPGSAVLFQLQLELSGLAPQSDAPATGVRKSAASPEAAKVTAPSASEGLP